MSSPVELPEELRKQLEEALTVSNGIRWKAASDLLYELGAAPVNVFSRDVDDATRTRALADATEKARAAFLAGEDRGGFLRPSLSEATAAAIPGFPEFLVSVKAGVVQEDVRVRTLGAFEDVAAVFPALVLALVRLVHAAPEKTPKTHELEALPQPWTRSDPRKFLLSGFLEQPLRILVLSEIRSGLEKAGLAPEAADTAARGVRDALLDAVRKWPRGGPYRASLSYDADGTPRLPPDEDVTEVYAFTEDSPAAETDRARTHSVFGDLGELFVLMGRASRVLVAYLSPLREELFGQAAFRAGAEAASKVAIPSEAPIPYLFNIGVPVSQRLARFGAEPIEAADRSLESVSVQLLAKRAEDVKQELLFEAADFETLIPKTTLDPEAWRSGVLAMLPKVLGPERLTLYYATWHFVDMNGAFPFHPLPFLDLFGMPDDTRNRRKLSQDIERLTRFRMKLWRKWERGAGTLEEAEAEFPLIERSSERITLKFRDHPKLERITYFRHPKTMCESRGRRYVKVPEKAFQLVGKWREGRGSKEDGVKALALVTTAYVFARAYATREGRQGEARYLGADGYELPLEEIALASGFTSPEAYRKSRGRVTERVAAAVSRLALEFRFFGPGSTVKNGRFRFEPTDELRADLLPIVEAHRLTPKKTPVLDVPAAPRRGRKPRRG